MISTDRRSFRYFDWITALLIVTLSCIGLIFVLSATYKPELPYSIFFKKQLFGIISGLVIYGIMCCIDYRSIQQLFYVLYFVIVGLLFFTSIKGNIGMGAQRWLSLGFIKFQPSELAKLFFPGFFSYYLFTEKNQEFTLASYIPIIAILGVSTLLILKQPDLGTALIILFTSIIMLWLSGMTRKFFVIGTIIFLVSAPITWQLLKPYQKKRIAVFLGEGEHNKERYHIEQSKIAIGSGGFYGKGYLQGTQNKLQFLPESRTDFIFSVICEEWGFIGALLVIILYTLLFFRLSKNIFMIHKNFYAQLFTSGLTIHIIFSTIINIGMVIGLLPIVGIPLPLLSYGISNLWITYASLGCIASIVMHNSTLPQQ